jgi:hypothetical protein
MAIGQPDPSTVGPLAAKVLRYTDLIEQTVHAAKAVGFQPSAWDALGEVVAVDTFQRVGNFMEIMDWQGYVDMLTRWATSTDFWSQFRRISEVGNVVFLELEEHNTPEGGAETVVNSLSLYEFDDAGKIRHLDIYLQYRPEGMAAQWGEVEFADSAAG